MVTSFYVQIIKQKFLLQNNQKLSNRGISKIIQMQKWCHRRIYWSYVWAVPARQNTVFISQKNLSISSESSIVAVIVPCFKDYLSFFRHIFCCIQILFDAAIGNEYHKIECRAVRYNRHENSFQIVFNSVKLDISIIFQNLFRNIRKKLLFILKN